MWISVWRIDHTANTTCIPHAVGKTEEIGTSTNECGGGRVGSSSGQRTHHDLLIVFVFLTMPRLSLGTSRGMFILLTRFLPLRRCVITLTISGTCSIRAVGLGAHIQYNSNRTGTLLVVVIVDIT